MSRVLFTLNGEQHSVDVDEAAGKTLNEYIRCRTPYTATKTSCAQGGCGACTVTMARPGDRLHSVVSCLTPLASAHGAAVVTAEGLTAQDGTPHPVAERLAKFNGSQCGFCTPGMVMQLFSTLSAADGGKACGEKELESCINANICRCTGYRPILECAKSFAADTTVTNQLDPSVKVGPYDALATDPKLSYPPVQPLMGKSWLRPTTVKEALSMIGSGAVPIAGGTAGGIYRECHVASANLAKKVFADISAVQELSVVSVEGTTLRIGATVTWSGFVEALKDVIAKVPAQNVAALSELANRCGTIAGSQVRNRGTIGGNIALVRNKSFMSDWVPPLAALGASVEVCSVGAWSTENHNLLSFVQDESPFDGMIVAVLLPLPPADVVFRSFRIAHRSRNAHAYVNAGFAASLSGGKINQVTIVLGAFESDETGAKMVRLKRLERAMVGMKSEDVRANLASVTTTVCEQAKADLFPLSLEVGREVSEHVVGGFIIKFLVTAFRDSLPKQWQSAEYCLHDVARSTTATQNFPPPTDLKGPLNKPMTKTSALEQTMGTAKFTDDIPLPENTLIAAFVLCPEANVEFKGIDDSQARAMLGESFHSLITADDLAVSGVNANEIQGLAIPPDYKADYDATQYLLLPPGQVSKFAGQPVGVLLVKGDKLRLTEQVASMCRQSVRFERCGPVAIGGLIGGQEVIEPMICSKGKVPAAEVIEKAKAAGGEAYISGKFTKASQMHNYMERQSTVVVPDEDGIACYVAAQSADTVQKFLCKATGLLQSKVSVKYRRVGGGFGGKLLAPAMLSAVAAQCALKAKRPVRFVLPQETDCTIVGGRQEIEATWEAAVDSQTGKIRALSYDIWMAHGMGEDMQKVVAHMIPAAIDECYDIPSIAANMHLVKQHLPNRTAVRAPGHLEAALLMEAVFDGVSSRLGLPGHVLRERNFFRGKFNKTGLSGVVLPTGHLDGYSNLAMWDHLKSKTNYEQRYKAVQDFNKGSAWKKRGISMTPARYGMMVTPGNAARVDIFKDGSVQIAVSGTEMGQGLHTKVGQLVCTQFERKLGAGPPMSCIRFLDTSTEQNPNGTLTGGSTTSESAMFAAGDAVRQLAERLSGPAKKARGNKEDQKNKDGPWFDIIDAAFGNKFLGVLVIPPNLSAVGMHMTDPTAMMYETYGVAASEVELDVLTGETHVLFAHLVFDVGMSYNPMVDIGQMEGAFIMGMGQCLTEGTSYDAATGKNLTTNTWKYKPPIAWDVPNDFTVELLDMRKHRLDNPVMSCMMGAVGPMLGFFGIPWKPTKTDKAFMSSKAIGEPPVLLAASVSSAVHAATVAATGRPLPDCSLPMPCEPFAMLPLLEAQKPGSGNVNDEASTATGTSAASGV